MVHAFESMGVYIALDVESGAAYWVDELVYDLLRGWDQGPEQASARLAGKYEPTQLQEAVQEIQALIDQGALFSPAVDYSDRMGKGDGAVKAMCLHAAHDCNMRCAYCFAETGEYQGERCLMDAATGKAALDWLMAHSAKRQSLEVDFFGGEPLMAWGAVKETVAHGRKLEQGTDKRFHFTITTNALGLNDEVTQFLNREMDNVVISIDGRQETHDRMRPLPNGKGSYDLVLDHARRFVATRGDKQYYVRGTFTRHNLDFTQDVKCLYDNGFREISIEPVVASPEVPYSLTEAELPAVMAEYDRLAHYYRRVSQSDDPFRFFHFMLDLSQGPCIIKRLTGCGVGNEYVAVTPKGDIYPCHQFVGQADFKMGNVHEGTFDTRMQARFAANHVLNKPECMDCWAKYYCSGGCSANAWQFRGDISLPYKLGCEMEKKRLECAFALHVLAGEKEEA